MFATIASTLNPWEQMTTEGNSTSEMGKPKEKPKIVFQDFFSNNNTVQWLKSSLIMIIKCREIQICMKTNRMFTNVVKQSIVLSGKGKDM